MRGIGHPDISYLEDGPPHDKRFIAICRFEGVSYRSDSMKTRQSSKNDLIAKIYMRGEHRSDENAKALKDCIEHFYKVLARIRKRILSKSKRDGDINQLLLFISGLEINPGPPYEEFDFVDDNEEAFFDVSKKINLDLNEIMKKKKWSITKLNEILASITSIKDIEDYLEIQKKVSYNT